MDLKTFMMNLFMIIGMIVCVVVTVIALIYGLCYAIKLLFKTFGAKISSSYDVMMEDIREKGIAKKERNKEKRIFNNEHKKEMQKLKLLSEAEVFEMKKRKYRDKLRHKENKAWSKLYGDTEPRQIIIPQLEEKSSEVCNSKVVNTLLMDIPVAEEVPVPATEADETNAVDTFVVATGDDVMMQPEAVETPVAEVATEEQTVETTVETVEEQEELPTTEENTESEVVEEQSEVLETETEENVEAETVEGLKLNEIENVEEVSVENAMQKKRGRKKKR